MISLPLPRRHAPSCHIPFTGKAWFPPLPAPERRPKQSVAWKYRDDSKGAFGFADNSWTGEVYFLVSRDGEPWFLAECKNADTSISPAMKSFQKEIGVPHAFQVVFDLPYAETGVFGWGRPVAVSARTFLSQLP